MTPTVLVLNPEAVTFTAKVRMAPTTSRKMLTPRLKLLASSMTLATSWLSRPWLFADAHPSRPRAGRRGYGVCIHPP
jgi:hypothetical protein